MNDIIDVNNDTQTVSARDLHEKLELKTRFSKWVDQNFRDFEEFVDYTSVTRVTVVNNGANREIEDYQLSLDMAKHLCVLSRTEKGKLCRQYLIDLEKAWNTPEQVMARALRIADETINSLQIEVKELKPKAIICDTISASNDSITIGQLAKILCKMGYPTGEKRLFEEFRKSGYLIKQKGKNYNLPTQKAIDMGVFEIVETPFSKNDGNIGIRTTTYVTGKGQVFFCDKISKWKENQKEKMV